MENQKSKENAGAGSVVSDDLFEVSRYGLPPTGKCESYRCKTDRYEQCKAVAPLCRVLPGISGNHKLADGHWEQYSCETAQAEDRSNGFEVIPISAERRAIVRGGTGSKPTEGQK